VCRRASGAAGRSAGFPTEIIDWMILACLEGTTRTKSSARDLTAGSEPGSVEELPRLRFGLDGPGFVVGVWLFFENSTGCL
jgi:hypothetical protein